MSKLNYTAEDAAGCILQKPNYEQCKNCFLYFDDTPESCPAYPLGKPPAVIYDGKPCKKKRVIE